MLCDPRRLRHHPGPLDTVSCLRQRRPRLDQHGDPIASIPSRWFISRFSFSEEYSYVYTVSCVCVPSHCYQIRLQYTQPTHRLCEAIAPRHYSLVPDRSGLCWLRQSVRRTPNIGRVGFGGNVDIRAWSSMHTFVQGSNMSRNDHSYTLLRISQQCLFLSDDTISAKVQQQNRQCTKIYITTSE